MPKGLIFFCCACAILLFTIINLSVGPVISGAVGTINIDFINRDYAWGSVNCAIYVDAYDEAKKGTLTKEEEKYDYEWPINHCKRKKAMHDMEYTSFIFNIVIGFVCGLLGLLHLLGVGNNFASKTGIIGLCCGIVGFIFSFVYVIINGIVYTNYYDDATIYKMDSDYSFAEWENGNGYKCIYYDEPGNDYSYIAKYSDLIKKQYNYDKDEILNRAQQVRKCSASSYTPSNCGDNGYIAPATKYLDCDKLYLNPSYDIVNKDKSDRFLTTLLLSLFVCLANIGLAIFGFLLFRSPGDFTKIIEVKN